MQILFYSIKCWLTSVLFGSICLGLFALFKNTLNSEPNGIWTFFEIGGIAFTYSFMVSSPAVILFFIFNMITNRYVNSKNMFRFVASITCLIIWFALVYFFFGIELFDRNQESYFLTVPSLIGLLFGIWNFKVTFKKELTQIDHDDILDIEI